MAIKKRGFQSPWLQLALGTAAKFTQNLEDERQRQNEYARKVALMSQEQAYRASEKSQEQTLADTRLKEQRAYNEGQTDESRAYAATINAQQEEKTRQQAILENDPTRRIAGSFNPDPNGWSGTAGFPGGSAVESALAEKMAEIAKERDPQRRLAAIEQYNPKDSVGQSAYINSVFYKALGPIMEATQAELRKDQADQAVVDQINGALERIPGSGGADAWFTEISKLTAKLKDRQLASQLGLSARTLYAQFKTQQKSDATTEARVSPEERIARDVAPAVVKSGLSADPEADPAELLRRANIGVSTSRVAAGVGSEADSLLIGAKQPPMTRRQVQDEALGSIMTPDQLAAIRAQQPVGGAAAPAAPMSGAAPPPEVAAAIAGPAVPQAVAQPTAPSAGAMPGVAGPKTKQAAQMAVRAGRFKTEQEAIDWMRANGGDTSQ